MSVSDPKRTLADIAVLGIVPYAENGEMKKRGWGPVSFSRFLKPDETIVWRGDGGGSTDVQTISLFLIWGAIVVPGIAIMHATSMLLTMQNLTVLVTGSIIASGLVSKLIRGPDIKNRDYVLTNQRLIVGNFDRADALAMHIVHEANRASIQRIFVRSRADYSAICIETNEGGIKQKIRLLDQEKPAELAELIRKTLTLA
ncbi:MAG: hypothetical protein EON93_03470 [Burkholderiales bacterium]|nr:MAG: hypothetical protein EON93_03470 [Burkholderiales bacterium]